MNTALTLVHGRTMEHIGARVPDELYNRITAFTENEDCSQSEAIRTLLERGLDESEIQQENRRLQNEKEVLITNYQERTDLDTIREQYQELSQQLQNASYQEQRQRALDRAPITTRLKWKVTGIPESAIEPKRQSDG